MHSFSTALVALVAASLASAKPVPAPAKQGFTVSQSVPKPFVPGPVAVAAAYQKYNKAAPSDVTAAANGEGSVVANPESLDAAYLCEVSFGNGQTLNLDFDTGSADLWVFSTELSSSEQSGHTLYKPQSSNKLQGETWSISYGDGSSSSGDVYSDTVTIGGVSVTGQAVEAAEKVSSAFEQDPGDGLVGLAFSSINTVTPDPQTTFFDTAIKQGILDQNVFTADLKAGEPGSYDFGFIDSSKYTGTIAYANVDNSNGFWQFSSSGYAVGSGKKSSTSINGIADTGTTLLYLPDNVVSAYYKQVSGAQYDNSQGGYTFPCSATLPSFTLVIGSYDAVVPGEYINYAPASGSSCFGGIQSNTGIGFSIFGDIFLKSQFVVFDSDNQQVGFAAKNL